ncbi:MAG: hypothetical protein IKK58_02955 [Clostridia bacterium]|nr:hypothetical protein [Clostridia bacterium]
MLFSKMLSIICAIAILLSVINLPSLVFAVEEEPQGYDASGLTVENMPQEVALAGLTAYLYDVFDWDRNDEKNFAVVGIDTGVSQHSLWELQYGGYGKAYMVTGRVRYQVLWTELDEKPTRIYLN